MSIELKPHNEETYKRIKEKFKVSNKVAVVHPTGTGKSFLALKLLEENRDKSAIYIAPTKPILHIIKENIIDSGMNMTDFPNLKRKTYQKIVKLSDEEIRKMKVDIIILDEFHHCGAPEWGASIDRLLECNPDAQVLGLSATPIRYFDQTRDMAEELFENNIASEMSLEEAINRGILPKAKYVTALYEFEGELGKIEEEIKKIKDPEKKKQAQAIFENLSKKIDENTKNLPLLLSEHMKDKNGKYIVFCKNIKDMQDKIKQAQTIFGQVNSNIEIYEVSSQKTETENNRTLKRFEKDNNENKLKLIFAVDMLNEGYHIKDLDGVVMMRPTYSPTVYTQQLGRGLTIKVEDGRVPVIIDLVNNFDSIKIIENLYEKLKGYEATGQQQSEQNSQNGLIIHDTIKEFREIARKISELSKRDIVTLQDKIDIFQKYFEEGNEEIDGQTIFKGYPIGQWATQMRYQYNRNDERFNASEEEVEILSKLGIFERRIDSTIDEKIDALVEWFQNYPDIKVERRAKKDEPISTKTIEKLRELAQNQGIDFAEIEERYRKMQSYNEYIRQREWQGKLTQEQIMKCKDGGLGGKFGFPTKIEEMAKTLKISENQADSILKKYKSINNFIQMYRKYKVTSEEFELFNPLIDMDFCLYGKHYANFLCVVFGERTFCSRFGQIELALYSSKNVDEVLETLSQREEIIIKERFGLNDGRVKSFEEIGRIFNISRKGVIEIEAKALRKLRHPTRGRKLLPIGGIASLIEHDFITDEEKEQIANIEEEIWKSDLIVKNAEVSDEIKEKFKEKLATIRDIVKKLNDRAIKFNNIRRCEVSTEPISECRFSERVTNRLISLGIKTVEELYNTSYKKLEKISYFTDEGKSSIEGHGVEENTDYNVNTSILELDGISLKTIYTLRNSNILTIGELAKIDEDELLLGYGLDKKEIEKISETRENLTSKNVIEDTFTKLEKDIMEAQEKVEEEFRSREFDARLRELQANFRYDEAKVEENKSDIGITALDDILIGDMDFSLRAWNCLRRKGIRTLGDLRKLTEEELMSIRNLGPKSRYEISKKLEEYESKSFTDNNERVVEDDETLSEVLELKAKAMEEARTKITGESKLTTDKNEEQLTVKALDTQIAENESVNGDLNLDNEPIEHMKISVKATNSLIRAGIKTVGDLTRLTEEELKLIPHLGTKTATKIISELKKYRITQGSNVELKTDKNEEQLTEETLIRNFEEKDIDGIISKLAENGVVIGEAELEANKDIIYELLKNTQEAEITDKESVVDDFDLGNLSLEELATKENDLDIQEAEITDKESVVDDFDLDNLSLEELATMETNLDTQIEENKKALQEQQRKEVINRINKKRAIIKEQEIQIANLQQEKDIKILKNNKQH